MSTSASLSLPEPWVHLLDAPELASTLRCELQRELGSGHVLTGQALTAVARCSLCDDVVFRVDASDTFAIVHLTWSSHPEAPGWPYTELFPDVAAVESAVAHHEH